MNQTGLESHEKVLPQSQAWSSWLQLARVGNGRAG